MGCGPSTESKRDVDGKGERYLKAAGAKTGADGSKRKQDNPETARPPLVMKGPSFTTCSLVKKNKKTLKFGEIIEDEEKRTTLYQLISGQLQVHSEYGGTPIQITSDCGNISIAISDEELNDLETAESIDLQTASIVLRRTGLAKFKCITMKNLLGHARGIRALALSPDDWMLVSIDSSMGSQVPLATISDLRTNKMCGVLDSRQAFCDTVCDCSYAIDGAILATVHRVEHICIWDMSSFRLRRTISHPEPIDCSLELVELSTCGKLIAVAAKLYEENELLPLLMLFEINGNFIRSIEILRAEGDGSDNFNQYLISAIAISPCSKRVAIGLANGTIIVIEVRTGEVLFRKECHPAPIRSIKYSSDGLHLMSCDEYTVGYSVAETLEVVWYRICREPCEIHFSPTRPLEASKEYRRMSISQNPSGTVSTTCGTFSPCNLIMLSRTNKSIQFISASDGSEVHSIPTAGIVVRLSASYRKVAMGDILGNLYIVSFV